jgi:hypothetical protein
LVLFEVVLGLAGAGEEELSCLLDICMICF